MSTAQQIMHALSEVEIAQAVGKRHDDARLRYPVSGPVSDFAGFERAIGEYFAYHFSTCIVDGARMPLFEAQERAK